MGVEGMNGATCGLSMGIDGLGGAVDGVGSEVNDAEISYTPGRWNPTSPGPNVK